MRRVWATINLFLISGFLFEGYYDLLPGDPKMKVNWVIIISSFLAALAAPALVAWFGRRLGVEKFRRPSLMRAPLSWWTDSLQLTRITLLALICNVLGAAAALPRTDVQGVALFWWFLAMALGWFAGERLVYVWLKEDIVASSEPVPHSSEEAFSLFFFAAIFLVIGLSAALTNQFQFSSLAQQHIITRSRNPLFFMTMTFVFFAFAGSLFGLAIFRRRK